MCPADPAVLLLLLLGLSVEPRGADKQDLAFLESICGRPAVPSSIFSGMEANVGQWPWQASIRQGSLHICSATLISQKWVLTMASCFRSKNAREYSVLVGSLQISGHPDLKERTIPVSRIIPHPDFQGDVSSAIAVVELAHLVALGPVILPICLPSSGIQLKDTNSCWVTGWGYAEATYQHIKPSYTLKELKVSLIDLQTCSGYYQNESLLREVKPLNSEAMICSKLPAEKMDQCVGSRGDPLMCEVESFWGDFWVLVGVVSWGSNCIRTSEPGVYTNISFYRSWIEKSVISLTELSATPSLGLSGLLPVMPPLLNFLGPP